MTKTTTTTTETIDVPQTVIDTIVSLFAVAAQQGRDFNPAVADALRAIVDQRLPAGRQPGTVRVSAEAAWHLADCGDAIDVFDLDEDADSTWSHPAVRAQQQLADLVDDQAPATAARLGAELEAGVADAHSSN